MTRRRVWAAVEQRLVLLISAVWVLLSYALFSLSGEWKTGILLVTHHLQDLRFLPFIIATPLLVVAEFLVLMWFLSCFPASLLGRFAARALATGYLIYLVTQWGVFQVAGRFLPVLELPRFLAQLDIATFVAYSRSASDLALTFALLLGVYLLVVLFSWLSRFLTRRGHRSEVGRAAVLCLVVVLAAQAIGVLSRTKQERVGIVQAAVSRFSPQLSLSAVWMDLWGVGDAIFEKRSLQLISRSMIDPVLRGQVDPLASSERRVQRPKLMLVVLVEALRADVLNLRSPNGQEVTPFLNQLARSGFAYPVAYSAAADTMGAQIATLVGVHPRRFPYQDPVNVGETVPPSIFSFLKRLGYRTGYFTDEWLSAERAIPSIDLDLRQRPTHPTSFVSASSTSDSSLAPSPDAGGATTRRWLPEDAGESVDRELVSSALDWIAQAPTADTFAAIYLSSSHFPYLPSPNPDLQIVSSAPVPAGVTFFSYPKEHAALMWGRYKNALRSTDKMVENFFKELQKQGVLSDALVIVTGDHGELFHEVPGEVTHGARLREQVLRVPFVISGASRYVERFDRSLVASHLDIAPTIFALASELSGSTPSVSAEQFFQGKSLLIQTGNESPLDPIFVSNPALEDGVICYPAKLVVPMDGTPERFSEVRDDGSEAPLRAPAEYRASLRKLLDDFRSVQYSYFLDREAQRDFLPPNLRSQGLRCPVALMEKRL